MTAVSAPGKVLLAGGYLVVDRAYTGLVFGLSARIHVIVQPSSQTGGGSGKEILVRSPQFQEAEWSLSYRFLEENRGVEVVPLERDPPLNLSRNKFVETALAFALSYISESTTRVPPTTVTILADDDYYSQSHTSTKCKLNETSKFQNFNVTLNAANKTGLGSSAALVTAFVASVLAHYLPESDGGTDSGVWKCRVHNLAQAAHCTAQGKIGSGFDIAAAVYGSCIYRRFSPSVLERMGSIGSKGFATRLKETVDDVSQNKIWDTQIIPSAVQMPQRLRLVMCDVDCGSETPSMVRKVFAWRNDKVDQALSLWRDLQKGNDKLASQLKQLSADSQMSLEGLSTTLLANRSLIREMSEKANVPIEPSVQTELLDACSSLPGVVGGLVPGAGGYDAVALIIEDKNEVVSLLTSYLATYKTKTTHSGPSIGKVRLLGAKQEMDGIRKESEFLYDGWI